MNNTQTENEKSINKNLELVVKNLEEIRDEADKMAKDLIDELPSMFQKFQQHHD